MLSAMVPSKSNITSMFLPNYETFIFVRSLSGFMAKTKRKKVSKRKTTKKNMEFELPLWVVVFMTVVLVMMWFVMSQATFLTIYSFSFWLVMTMIFLIPVLVLWMIYFEILKF